MPSIKDPKYKLPIIEPLQSHKVFLNSANKPLLIRGVDIDTHIKNDYVVKLMAAERMSGAASMRELLAAFIALELELPVALPAVMRISQEFLNHRPSGQESHQILLRSIGDNFATVYVENFLVPAVHQNLPNTLLDLAADIFAFDVLVQNADRSHEPPKKPNVLTNGRDFLIFDHEVAFGFVFELSFSRNNEPWIIRQSDEIWIRKHCFFAALNGHIFDQQNLLHKFARLDSHFWNMAWELMPDTWRDAEQFEMIKSHVNQIVGRKEIFVRNLQTLLL